MYVAYIMKRTQIYLDEDQDRRLAERAAAVGRTKSALIREAVDTVLPPSNGADERLAEFRAAARAAFGIAPHQAESFAELREINRRRRDDLDEHWHGG